MPGLSLPATDECHIWLAPLRDFAPYAGELDALLPVAEREMVDRQRLEPGRSLARLSRAMLRLLAGEYLGADPHELDVDRTCRVCGQPHGKPRVRGASRLHSSVAHCADLLVLAFARAGPLGVDVESLEGRIGVPAEELVAMALTPSERRHVEDAPHDERWRVFLRYWTSKEAVLKQLGVGLSLPLQDVRIGDARAGGEVTVAGLAPAPVDLRVRLLQLSGPYIAAIASAGEVAVSRVEGVPLTLLTDRS